MILHEDVKVAETRQSCNLITSLSIYEPYLVQGFFYEYHSYIYRYIHNMNKIGEYAYLRVTRDNGAVGYHIPGFISEVFDDGTFEVTFEMYGHREYATLTVQEIQDASDEVALGLKTY